MAYERRMMEIVSTLQPQTRRWRLVLLASGLCTAFGAFQWLTDPDTSQVTLIQSLCNHWFFAIASLLMVALFFLGIHNRVIAPQM